VRRQRLGFVFQTFNLVPVLTAYENVELPLLLLGVGAAERRRRVHELLEALGIGDLAYHRPDEMSGGQQQRVSIARALVTEPALVLADEPTANLDSETGKAIIELMHDLNTKRGTTFVFSTHDPKVMERASRVVQIRDGRIDHM
ncbi:MAG: ABC transporter ATP-binding protein, partial [Candidatus Methanomethylicaceae archaeon]